MNRKILTAKSLVLGFILLFVSCFNEDEKLIGKRGFYWHEKLILSYEYDGSNIIIYLDAISDYTNATEGEWPDKDLYKLYIDYNNNGELDSGIDFGLSPKGSKTCFVTLFSQNSNSTCSYNNDIVGIADFGPTDKWEESHVNYKISIPKEILSTSSKSNFVVELYDSENTWSEHPSISPLFDRTFEITW